MKIMKLMKEVIKTEIFICFKPFMVKKGFLCVSVTLWLKTGMLKDSPKCRSGGQPQVENHGAYRAYGSNGAYGRRLSQMRECVVQNVKSGFLCASVSLWLDIVQNVRNAVLLDSWNFRKLAIAI